MFKLIAFCAGAVLALSAGAALAASEQDHIDCRSYDAAKIIAGCTRILQDRSESAANRAMAYGRRGQAYRLNLEHDRSIADFTAALKRAPDSVHLPRSGTPV